jgi:predicted transcriptional regulator
MTTEIITRDDNSSVKEATEIINLNKISCLIAARKGKAVEIITERDLLKRVILEAKNRQKKSPKLCQSPRKSSHPTRT